MGPVRGLRRAQSSRSARAECRGARLFGGAVLAPPSANRPNGPDHPSTTTPRRSCKQLPSRSNCFSHAFSLFPPVARWLLRRSVARRGKRGNGAKSGASLYLRARVREGSSANIHRYSASNCNLLQNPQLLATISTDVWEGSDDSRAVRAR